MSSDIENHPYAVSTPDFVRFLEAKTLDRPCPGCGAARWILIGPGDNGPTYLLRTQIRGASKPTQVTTMAVHCDECGFLRQHSAKVVRKWVDDNPEGDQQEFGEEDLDVND